MLLDCSALAERLESRRILRYRSYAIYPQRARPNCECGCEAFQQAGASQEAVLMRIGLGSMPNMCPRCKSDLASNKVRVHHERRPSIPWFRFAPPSCRCPNCNALLQQQIEPIGWLIIALLALVMPAAFLFAIVVVPRSAEYAWSLVGLAVVLFVPINMCYAKWGVSWTLI